MFKLRNNFNIEAEEAKYIERKKERKKKMNKKVFFIISLIIQRKKINCITP